MSHSKIRTEKICLNCGTETTGRYCPSCGQENIEPNQTVWHLITHFFSDITHFDGKFFLTVKDLFARPGFLSREYMIGRRASYLDPIRMYIFTSAFFFLIFFSLFDAKKLVINDQTGYSLLRDPELKSLLAQAKTAADTLRILHHQLPADTALNQAVANLKPGKGIGVRLQKTNYANIAAYDSVQNKKPENQRDGWLKRKIEMKRIDLNRRYDAERGDLFRELLGNFMHNFPKILFISLPLFALLLKMLYLRHKEFYYVDHGIFAIHLYIFTFLVLLVYFAFSELKSLTGWSWLGWLMFAILVYPAVYYFQAMRGFYGQSRRKTALKYVLLLVLSLFIQFFITAGSILFTVYES